ncbi:uncharacterized protein LOC132034986 [Lycium ferocissimum]|uniref:uncharacterized protein LOC132034986 n=1 Tax=Lycium ferocissimum TaxID=112874 RepID=UPI0028161E72|nr:uncharacterized protein LOC132034986 [Lycium ferocissimum]
MMKRPNKQRVQKNVKKSTNEEAYYQRPRCPITLEEFLPSWFRMKISHYDAKASCCNIDEEEMKKEDVTLPSLSLCENLIETRSEEVDTCDAKITFTNDDLLLGQTLHNRPLYMVGFVRGHKVNRIMIDDGSGVNILPIRIVKELGISVDELSESRLMIQGFNQGGQRAIGAVKLEINMGGMCSNAWMHVIDAKTSYNILLGRPWIHENKVVPSTYHQCFKYLEDGVQKKIVADDEPFAETEAHFADAKFYLKNRVLKEVKVDNARPIKKFGTAKMDDPAAGKVKVIVEKSQALNNVSKVPKVNMESSSKKDTSFLHYVPKAKTGEGHSSELQGNMLSGLTFPMKQIDAIKSSSKMVEGFVKSSNSHESLPEKRTDEGFDPNAYKLLAKAGYNPNEPSKLGKLPPEAVGKGNHGLNPTQRMMIEKGYAVKQSREGLGYKQPSPVRISIRRASNNYITTKEESTSSNQRLSVFDRLTNPTPRISVFDRLGPLKKKHKRQGNNRRMEAPVYAQKQNIFEDCPSLIPSRMRRETKLVVSCGEVLKAKTHTIIHTKGHDEDEKSVGSSYHIAIWDEQSTTLHPRVEEKFVDIHACHHISFNDGDPQEDEDAEDAPPEFEEGVKTTVDALKEVNLGTGEDPRPTYVSASLNVDEENKYVELLMEFKDVFAWSYKEMPGLDPKVAVHRLAVK